jgi:uncharacterized repeat protein (TIGR03803 family)
MAAPMTMARFLNSPRAGTLTTLYSFCSQSGCADGEGPEAALVQAANGDFYGTTNQGGANQANCAPSTCGTVFKITPSGTLTTLYSFCAQSLCADGAYPNFAQLVQATDGDLYGTTGGGGYGGGASGGTIFKITPNGTLTTLYSFGLGNPKAGLIQATNGDLYGTTYDGNAVEACPIGCGWFFSLSAGLGPFVETQPASGKAGAAVKILGNDLTCATSVSFNGAAAAFTVNSSGTAISTTVPSDATTGTVQVVTVNGTLSSNVPFRVP